MTSPFGRIGAITGAPLELRLLFSDPFSSYRDGTTTRVFRQMDDRVVVVTSCQVKAAFLKSLALVPGGVPGLPVVHRHFGEYARDEDDLSLWGECFEVEELHDPENDDERQQLSRFTDCVRALTGFNFGIDPQLDASLAHQLATADVQGTCQAFTFIAEFLRTNNAVLDALVPRNVMFTKSGRLCLADPVTFVPPSSEYEVTVYPGTVIRVNREQRSGELVGSGIKDALRDDNDDEDGRAEASADGFESLLLGLAIEGVDVSTPALRRAIETALEALGNNF